MNDVADVRPPSVTRMGEPLVYHCMTRHQGVGLGELIAMAMSGFELRNHFEREERGDELDGAGIHEIDIQAGDGEAIFFTIGSPIKARGQFSGLWASMIRNVPCVGYRLSDLAASATLRPSDLQSYYQRIADVYPWSREEDSIYAVDEVLQVVRSAIELPSDWNTVRRIMAGDGLVVSTPASVVGDLSRAAEKAVDDGINSGYEFFYDDDQEDVVDDNVEDAKSELIERALETIDEGLAAWQRPRVSDVEFVVWDRAVPLADAAVFVGADGQWEEALGD